MKHLTLHCISSSSYCFISSGAQLWSIPTVFKIKFTTCLANFWDLGIPSKLRVCSYSSVLVLLLRVLWIALEIIPPSILKIVFLSPYFPLFVFISAPSNFIFLF
jgi:hypothetical protein